jgi:hypothetical protein
MAGRSEDNTVPKYLFRYRSFADRYDSLRRILVNNEWYFGSRVDFDDQADCKLPGILIDRDHLRRVMAKKDGGKLSEAREKEIEQFLANPKSPDGTLAAVQKYVDSVGILCLSELHEDPELWKIYADSGRGVCLCLETLKIAFAADYIERGPFEVIYSDDPKLPWDPRGDRDYQNAQTEDHLLRKGTIWAYQKEWRFFLHRGEESTVGFHPLPPEALQAVILGPRLTEGERELVRSWIKAGPFAHAICRTIR